MNTLPDSRYLTICDTMQSLCLHNDKREEAMNGHLTNTANSDVIQSSISLKPSKQTLNTGSPGGGTRACEYQAEFPVGMSF